jgi:hypothetical protein
MSYKPPRKDDLASQQALQPALIHAPVHMKAHIAKCERMAADQKLHGTAHGRALARKRALAATKATKES